MKRIIKFLSLILATLLLFTGCGTKSAANKSADDAKQAEKKTTKLVVGATPSPHAEILNLIKPDLKEKGIDLEVKEFNDYVTPNVALNDKQLDANFFQHTPYMEEFEKEKNIKLVAVAKIHVEPMGAYSKKLKSKDEIKDGATIAIPNDATNEGRALLLLQKQGLIKLKDESGLTQTPKDITENPKNLKFSELEAPQLPRVIQDVDLAIINTNFALKGNLDPLKDTIFSEDKDSPYANVITTRPDNQDDPAIKELVKALQSDKVRKYLEDTYKGAIVPAF
ncbi:MAG TPA: methionine ABC transporter substrate-binding protein [Clostridiaceae bacterium]|jgi:D-methionine transport system substrate-binding protein|nr:methionine ABC transporter substrate-binding protein [Clostridiaceae bacterium]